MDTTTLADHHAITTLVHRLGAALDQARFDDLRELCAADATATTPGGHAEGVDAVVAQASRNHSAEDIVQHVITDVIIDLDGAEATVRANTVVTFVRAGGTEPYRTMGGIYRFGARRTDGAWRLTSVATTPVWHTGTPPAPRVETPEAAPAG